MRCALYLSNERFCSQVEVGRAKVTDLVEATDMGRVGRGVVGVSNVEPSRGALVMRKGDGFGTTFWLYRKSSADSTDEGEEGEDKYVVVDARFGHGVEGRDGSPDDSEVLSEESSE